MTTEKVIAQLNIEISTGLLEVLKGAIEEKLKSCIDFFEDEAVEFDPMGWSGGNFNDCFDQGCRQGETDTLRTVISMIDGLIEIANENKK